MQPKTLSNFEALIFDVYGTLIDWELGIYNALQTILTRANKSWSQDEALFAFHSVEKDLEAQNPGMLYNQLLASVHKALATRIGTSSTPEEDAAFGSSISSWPAFSDTVAALAKLKKYYKLIVLSNVDNNSFNTFTRPILEAAGGSFDVVLTAQDIGSYKPDTNNFEVALKTVEERFGIPKEKVLVTANSLYHDHGPANLLGISSSWIERDAHPKIGDLSLTTYDFHFKTLGEMAEEREKGVLE